MDPVYTDLLSIWGAVVATTLAIIQIVSRYRDKPNIKVSANLVLHTRNENEELKGTRVVVEDSGLVREVLLAVTAANHGKQPLQLTGVILEEESTGNVTQVLPERLPAVLDPLSSITVEIQKEWLDQTETTLLGVVDALGHRHSITRRKLEEVMKRCAELPTNKRKYVRRDDPNEVVTAWQPCDASVITNTNGPAVRINTRGQ